MLWTISDMFSILMNFLLTHFIPIIHFYAPRNREKNLWFSDDFWGIETEHWAKMGFNILKDLLYYSVTISWILTFLFRICYGKVNLHFKQYELIMQTHLECQSKPFFKVGNDIKILKVILREKEPMLQIYLYLFKI